jgi:preprotein translocase SecF subunit
MLLRGLFNQSKEIQFFSFSNLLSYISLGAILVSIILFSILGLNYGIDFRGGTMFMVSSSEKIKVSDVRNTLSGSNLGDVSISQATNPLETLSAGTLTSTDNIFIIKVEKTEGQNIETKVKALLLNKVPDIKFLQIESVGSKVSSELVRNGMLAVLFAVISVLIYIWLRFEWQFALGAVFALIHDVILTVGVFSILRYEFNLSIIAALLTIIGYSLNDTVVVFDRVRENLRNFKSLPLLKVLNMSINNTLSRTIMTSVTTLLALFALYFLGGDVIRGFTFAMIWGVLVGTYSSIFVAAKILLILDVKRNWDEKESKAGTQF